MNEFIEKILANLKSNGFPAKKVSLPTEKMYEAADNRGLSFNKVLEQMKADHQIDAQVGTDKIIFSQVMEAPPAGGFNFNEDMIRQAQEMMNQMDPEELRKLQEQFASMTPEQKAEIMKKGKDMGII